MLNFLHHMLCDNQYDLPASTENQFIHYLDLLTRWNKVFNLTRIQDPKQMVILHLLDSLSIHPYLHGTQIIDVGTGAGLPGIPLALLYPAKKFVLVDSNSKKTRFLTQAVCELKLSNVEIIHARCEDFYPGQRFDSILSRAFASLRVMLEATQHLANQHGQFLAMKGVYPAQEIQDMAPGFKLLNVHKLLIRGLDAERHVVCLVKEQDEWEKSLR